MKRALLGFSIAVLVLSFIACNSNSNSEKEKQKVSSTLNKNTKDMNSYISIFEIPAIDISRAINFYQAILDVKIEKIDFPDMQMGLLPYEGQVVTGVIVAGEDYQPSASGVTMYLNRGDNLQPTLDKVEESGGKIVVPKTPHADESGYFAIFIDTEGNRLGLHSVN